MIAPAGCGLKSATVPIRYVAKGHPPDVAGASAIQLRVEVADERRVKVQVGTKILKSVPIRTETDLPKLLQGAIEQELGNRGFRLGPGAVVVRVSLDNFWTNFESGWGAIKGTGEVDFAVSVQNPQGETFYADKVRGSAKGDYQVMLSDDAEKLLETSLHDAVWSLMEDPEFFAALSKAAGSSRPAGPETATPSGKMR